MSINCHIAYTVKWQIENDLMEMTTFDMKVGSTGKCLQSRLSLMYHVGIGMQVWLYDSNAKPTTDKEEQISGTGAIQLFLIMLLQN